MQLSNIEMKRRYCNENSEGKEGGAANKAPQLLNSFFFFSFFFSNVLQRSSGWLKSALNGSRVDPCPPDVMVLSRLTPLLRAIHRVVKAYGRFLFRPNDRLIRPRANRETSALFFFAKKKIFLKKKASSRLKISIIEYLYIDVKIQVDPNTPVFNARLFFSI